MRIETLDQLLRSAFDEAPGTVDVETPAPRYTASATRVALVGTFPPRRCGIATFTADIVASLREFASATQVEVFTLGGNPQTSPRDPWSISPDDPAAYVAAAAAMNAAAYDAIWIQHEFGIFGGEDGELVLDLIERLAAPVIITLHTVLASPSANQRRVIETLVQRSSAIMVMSRRSRDLLVTEYGADASRLHVIEHGAPDRPFRQSADARAALELADRPTLTTFGLLGPGKGLETAIRALPAIVRAKPDVIYRIVGVTHPNLVEREGEVYRDSLKAQALAEGVSGNIEWVDRYMDNEELFDHIEASDIYLTPYPNLQQSTSGTLSYAVALGRAVISTPYLHAVELLDEGVGILVPVGDSEAIARAVIELLNDPAALNAQQARAYAAGRATIWQEFARAAQRMIDSAVGDAAGYAAPFHEMPSANGLFAMSDNVGMLQHAIGLIPDRNHGYCLDDNARALMLMHDASHVRRADREKWALTYASFVQHAWNPGERRFRNFMGYDRRWLEDVGSDDSFGRALWALGITAERASSADLRNWAAQLFDQAKIGFADIDSPRAVALASLGAAAVLRVRPGHADAAELMERTGRLLSRLLAAERKPDWRWFEVILAYDNPRLPQALLEAGSHCHQPGWKAQALETLEWINRRQTSAGGYFRPVGSESFGRSYTQLPYDQQPLEALAAIEACQTAWRETGETAWLDHAHMAWRWFHGDNDRGLALADMAIGRCRDGLTPTGVNLNSGAESILALHASFAAIHNLGDKDDAGRTAATRQYGIETRAERAAAA